MTKPERAGLRALIAKYTAYCECDEWHIHTGEDKNADPTDGHMDFDEDKFETALLAFIEATCMEVIRSELMKEILISKEDMKALLVESIKRDMNETGYSSPTRGAIGSVMDGMKDELTDLMRGVLKEVILDPEFKQILTSEFKHKVAKMLVGELSGAVEKSVNEFRQDPRLRADMIQAIERIIDTANPGESA